MSSIFELTAEMRHLQQMLEDPDYANDIDVIEATMEGIDMEIEEKADSYAYIKRNIEADIDAIDKEMARLKERKTMLTNSKERLLNNLMQCMRDTGKLKFKTALNSFGIRKAGGKQPLILDVDPENIPAYFQKVKIEADTDAIRAELDRLGEGADFKWAHYGERSEYLSIR